MLRVVEDHYVYEHSFIEGLKKTSVLFHGGRVNHQPHLVRWSILMSVPVALKSVKQMDAGGAALISVLRTEI